VEEYSDEFFVTIQLEGGAFRGKTREQAGKLVGNARTQVLDALLGKQVGF
jgi:hypothetical protein